MRASRCPIRPSIGDRQPGSSEKLDASSTRPSLRRAPPAGNQRRGQPAPGPLQALQRHRPDQGFGASSRPQHLRRRPYPPRWPSPPDDRRPAPLRIRKQASRNI